MRHLEIYLIQIYSEGIWIKFEQIPKLRNLGLLNLGTNILIRINNEESYLSDERMCGVPLLYSSTLLLSLF